VTVGRISVTKLNPTRIFGGMGSLYTPANYTRGRYTFGDVTEPRGLAQPFLLVHNGKMSYEDMAQARYTGLIGKTTVPVFVTPYSWDAPNIQSYTALVDMFFSEDAALRKSPSNIHYYMELDKDFAAPENITGLNPIINKNKVNIRHLLTRVWPKLRPNGFKTWTDESFRYVACEQSWFDSMVDQMQYYITMFMQPEIHGGFIIHPYGLGTVRASNEGLHVIDFPSVDSNYSPNNQVRLRITQENRSNVDRGYTFLYMYLLARKWQRFHQMYGVFQPSTKEYSLLDEMAFASENLSYMNGYGENSMATHYVGTDISGQVRDHIGNGIATAYPWQNFDDKMIEELLELWVIQKIVGSRIKPYVNPAELELQHGDRIRAAFDWQRESNAELPGIGSEGQPYLMMARNEPGSNLLMPMYLRGDFENKYARRFTRTLSTTKVNIKNSEIQGNPFEPTIDKEQYIQWVVENDAKRWDIKYPWYQIMIWRFPLHGWESIVDDKGDDIVTDRYQAMMYTLAQMAQGSSVPSDGWFIHDSVGLYGSVALPVVAGQPNPIQLGIGEDRKIAEKSTETPAPERISQTRTSEKAEPAAEVVPPRKAPVAEGAKEEKLELPVQEAKGQAPPAPKASEEKK